MTSLIGFIAISIMIFEIYSGYTGGLYSELSEIFVPPVFIILGAILSSVEMVKRKRELEHVYQKLKKLEGREISITDTIEQKLNRLIDFLKENYASDVSREGMAAVIGIHPNYLGRLFKIYTGKKMNDYINFIRINEAIKQLEKDDTKIIDIAFSVGFESLATFNRVFKNVMGKTPSDYR
jgi:AraC-like DNA-binding protein